METITKAIWGEKHQNGAPASEEPVSGAMEGKNNTDSTTLLGSGSSENAETSDAISASAAADSQSSTGQEITLTPNNTPPSVQANTIDTASTSASTHPHPGNSSIKQQQQQQEDANHPVKTKEQLPAIQEKNEKTEPATQPSPKEAAHTSTPRGTGGKYIRSTGMAADGGDFDATRPGAGREADRLLEIASANQGPRGSKNDDNHHHHPADPLAAKKALGLGGKIKGMVHPHRHHADGNAGGNTNGNVNGNADGNEEAKKGSGLSGKVRDKILLGKH